MLTFKGKPVYITVFENKSSKPWRILEYGKIMGVVPPGGEWLVKSIDPATTYARFKRLTLKGSGEVELQYEKAWQRPAYWGDSPTTEFLNNTRIETQGVRIGDRGYDCYRGIPRLVPLLLLEPEFLFIEKVEWKEVTEKVPDPARPGFLTMATFSRMTKTPRSDTKIRELEKLIVGRVEAEKQKEVDSQLKRLRAQSGLA